MRKRKSILFKGNAPLDNAFTFGDFFDEAVYEEQEEMQKSVYDSLFDVRQTMTGFVVAFKLKKGFENSEIKIHKTVYNPISDIYYIYTNSLAICKFMQERIIDYNATERCFKSVDVDIISDECIVLEIGIKDPKRIEISKKYQLQMISI